MDDWVAFYSDDAVLLPPNDKKASGKENVRKYIGDLLMLPGLALSWEPAKVEVARSGDLAYTQGSYQLTTTGCKRQTRDRPRQNPRDLEEASRWHLEMCCGHVELRSSRHSRSESIISAPGRSTYPE